uniref:Uncharacterized protein n=1 Tax=Setaria italica TaxID=4555 RepID=K3XNU5_SETIT
MLGAAGIVDGCCLDLALIIIRWKSVSPQTRPYIRSRGYGVAKDNLPMADRSAHASSDLTIRWRKRSICRSASHPWLHHSPRA